MQKVYIKDSCFKSNLGRGFSLVFRKAGGEDGR